MVSYVDGYGVQVSTPFSFTVSPEPTLSSSLSGNYDVGQLIIPEANLSNGNPINPENLSINWTVQDPDLVAFNSTILSTPGNFSGTVSYIDGYGVTISAQFSFSVFQKPQIPPPPVITQTSSGYSISNLTQSGNFQLNLGTSLNIFDNFITSTSAGITVNGKAYILNESEPVQVGSNATSNIFVELTDIDYSSQHNALGLDVYSVPIPITQTTTINVSKGIESILSVSTIAAQSNNSAIVSQQPPAGNNVLYVATAVAIVVVAGSGVTYWLAKRPKKSEY